MTSYIGNGVYLQDLPGGEDARLFRVSGGKLEVIIQCSKYFIMDVLGLQEVAQCDLQIDGRPVVFVSNWDRYKLK